MRKFSMDYLNLMQILFQAKEWTNERMKDKMDFDLFMFRLFFVFINTIILLFRRPCYYHPPTQRDSRCERKKMSQKKKKCRKSSVSASTLIALKSYLTVQLPRIHFMCTKIVQMLDVEFISKENWNTVSFEQISKKKKPSKKDENSFSFFVFFRRTT